VHGLSAASGAQLESCRRALALDPAKSASSQCLVGGFPNLALRAGQGPKKPMAAPPSQWRCLQAKPPPGTCWRGRFSTDFLCRVLLRDRPSDLHDLEQLAAHRERLLTPLAEASSRHHWRSLPETLRIPQNWDAPGAPRLNVNYRGLDEALFVRRLMPFPAHKRRFQSLHPDDARMPPTK
jgi:hypothetical protein